MTSFEGAGARFRHGMILLARPAMTPIPHHLAISPGELPAKS
jgi:hypothetical protein